jgi:hypothetical protein
LVIPKSEDLNAVKSEKFFPRVIAYLAGSMIMSSTV